MEHVWTELDLGTLGDNIARMKAALDPGSEVIFVVKADAYGHGMLPVSRCAAANGVRWFAVAHIDEAISLADGIPAVTVMILGALRPDAVGEVVARRIIPLIVDEGHGMALAEEAASKSLVLRCHVKVDTGMGRLGIAWDRAADSIQELCRTRALEITGICTHLASADNPDTRYSQEQMTRFRGVVDDCRKRGITFQMRHVSNSGGFQNLPGYDYEGVRCGIELYGYGAHCGKPRISTRPFLHWKTTVAQVRKVPSGFKVGYGSTYSTVQETNLATLDVGYSDGYSRLLGNKAQVLIGGRRVPVVGRVSMNMITADLGPESTAMRGDQVVLLGAQGGEAVWADELAGLCGTIPYEVLTGIRTNARYLVDAAGRRIRAK